MATLHPALALDAQGEWRLGEDALAYRLLDPRACVLDLMGDESLEEDRARASRWPFAPRVVGDDLCVSWELQKRRYPRAYLWSRILVRVREICEEAAQAEIRCMALVVGKGISPRMREDLERAAQLARVETLWWVDKVQALTHAIDLRQSQATLPDAVPERSGEEAVPVDPLSQINQVLGVQSQPGPETAQLSHAEFGGPAVQASQEPVKDAVEEPGHEEEQADASDAEAPEAVADDQEEALAQASSSEEPAEPDLAGHWIWVADGNGLELAQVQLDPPQVLSRSLMPRASHLLWQDHVVRSLCEELTSEHELELGGESLAMVRVWDACAKMMDRLEKEAQTEVHLPHLSVHRDASFHYQSEWTRRKMDGLIAASVARLKARCEDASSHWQWVRHGSVTEMPAFARVGQQCPWLRRKDARLDPSDALRGAGRWIAERQGKKDRMLFADIMLGDIEWVHPSGFCKRLSLHGSALPCKEDLDLSGAQLEDEDTRAWSVFLCIPGAEEQEAARYHVMEVEIPDYAKDARVRVEVQRTGKVLLSRTPAAKNAGASDLCLASGGLDAEQIDSVVATQAQSDVARFVAMREKAMRKELGTHCTHLGKVLLERGEKMDDLLRTRLGEWVAKAKLVLNPEELQENKRAALAALTPVHEELCAMVETLTAPQKKSLQLVLHALPELVSLPEDQPLSPGRHPWWPIASTAPQAQAEPEPEATAAAPA